VKKETGISKKKRVPDGPPGDANEYPDVPPGYDLEDVPMAEHSMWHPLIEKDDQADGPGVLDDAPGVVQDGAAPEDLGDDPNRPGPFALDPKDTIGIVYTLATRRICDYCDKYGNQDQIDECEKCEWPDEIKYPTKFSGGSVINSDADRDLMAEVVR